MSKPGFYSDDQHRLLFFASFFLAPRFQGRNLEGEIAAKWRLYGV